MTTLMTKRILLGDEDRTLTALLALHLRNEEYEVICSGDGAEMLELARRERPDLILLSVTLLAGDDSVLDALTDYPDLAQIPLLYLLPEPTPSGRTRHPDMPRQSSIRKPVATGELLEKVAATLAEYAGAGRSDGVGSGRR